MANELSRTFEADGQEITLNPAVVTRYILGGKQVPEVEMAKAIMTCATRKLNPFSGDVNFLTHFDKATGTNKLTVAPSKDYYLRRAFADPRFRGIDDGVTVIASGVLHKKRGSAVYRKLGEELVGAWAAVFVDGFVEPVRVEVSLEEYDQGRALWKSKPATMLVKVADSQALRKAFPDLFTGTYDPAEMDIDEPEGEAPRAPGREPAMIYCEPNTGDIVEVFDPPEPAGDMQGAMSGQVYEMKGF